MDGSSPPTNLCLHTLARIPLLREVALTIGDGLPCEVTAFRVFRLGLDLDLPPRAAICGIPTPREVWIAGSSMTPHPLFFNRNGREHVDPDLLAEIRTQQLVTCLCGAHHEEHLPCFICMLRTDWYERRKLLEGGYGVLEHRSV